MDKIHDQTIEMLTKMTVYQLLDEIKENPELVKPILEVLESEGKLDDLLKDQRGKWMLKMVKGMF